MTSFVFHSYSIMHEYELCSSRNHKSLHNAVHIQERKEKRIKMSKFGVFFFNIYSSAYTSVNPRQKY